MTESQGNDIAKGKRVTGSDRASLADTLRKEYESGASVRGLAEASGRSYGFVHRLLQESGVGLRQRGGANRKPKTT